MLPPVGAVLPAPVWSRGHARGALPKYESAQGVVPMVLLFLTPVVLGNDIVKYLCKYARIAFAKVIIIFLPAF
jgi:hypothetical protein